MEYANVRMDSKRLTKIVQFLTAWSHMLGMVFNVRPQYAHLYFILIKDVVFMDFRTNAGFQNIGMVKIVSNIHWIVPMERNGSTFIVKVWVNVQMDHILKIKLASLSQQRY